MAGVLRAPFMEEQPGRTMHCRLCINFYGAGSSEGEGGGCYNTPYPPASFVTIRAKTTVHCSPDSFMAPLLGSLEKILGGHIDS
jgi:hypothetical protein